MKLIIRLFCTLFGVGYAPVMPGTLASLATLAAFRLLLHGLAWPWYLVLLLGLFFLGVQASSSYAASVHQSDPRAVVIDEVCGQLAALFVIPMRPWPLILAFVFFRFFDIIKPYPIRKLERIPGGWGIMADDLAAGVVSGILVHIACLWI